MLHLLVQLQIKEHTAAKLDGFTYKELKSNIDKVIKEIPKEKYENIIKGTYNRTEKYVRKPSNRRKTLKNYL